MTVRSLPPVGRIEGVLYQSPGGPDPSKGRALVQYTDPTGQWHQLEVPVLDALYLLNLLEQMSREAHLDHLRRPPGSPQ